MAERVIINEPDTLSDAEILEIQSLAATLARTPPLTPELAYLAARDRVGGEEFVQAREELRRLDKLDRSAERALNDYEERIERGHIAGKILPNNAITLRKLYLSHAQVRTQYNDSARRLESKLNALRTPETRAEIAELSRTLLREDAEKRLKVNETGLRMMNAVNPELEQQKINHYLAISPKISKPIKQRL